MGSKRRSEGSGWPPLPDNLGFPVYGLSARFTSSRSLGLCDEMDSGPWTDGKEISIWRVELVHTSEPDILVLVHTIGTRTAPSPSRQRVFGDAVATALFSLIQLAMVDPPGEARGRYIVEKMAEMRRLEDDLGSDEWRHAAVAVDGLEREALLHRIDDAWAAAVREADARGAEPGDHERVAVEDLSAYPSRY